MNESSTPKIQIDDDWKAQAQAEKNRLAQQVEKKVAATSASSATRTGSSSMGGLSSSTLPQASLGTLVSMLAAQALLAMGAIADPRTGEHMQSLDVARHHIDLLGILEDKMQGNLTPDEQDMLASTLYELRTRYIQASQAIRMK